MPFPVPDFLIGAPVINLNAGDTFAQTGTIAGLAPGVAWGMSTAIMAYGTQTIIATSEGDAPTLAVTMVEALDFAASGNWDCTILGLAAVTATWATATAGGSPVLQFDMKFFDTANPDPVLHTNTVWIILNVPITP